MDIPSLGMFLASFLSFFFLILFSMTGTDTILYRGKDVQSLRALAISDTELAVSRLVLLYIQFAPLYWFLCIPALGVALLRNGFSFLYLAGSLLFLLIGPVFALSICVVLTLVMIRLTKGRRFVMAQELISMLLLVVLIIGFSASMTRNMSKDGSLSFDFQAMQATLGPLFRSLVGSLSFFSWQADMLTSVSTLVLMLGLGVLCAILIGLLVTHTYTSNLSYLASNEAMLSKHRRQRSVRATGAVRALMKRDMVIIRSYSAFTFELLGELLVPVILLAVYAATGVLGQMEAMVQTLKNLPFFPQIIVLVFVMTANLGMLSSTSVSRQGSLFVLDKQYPLDASVFIKAKLLLHLVLVGIPLCIYLVASLLFFKLGLADLFWMLPIAALSVFCAANLHLAIDYRTPRLDWTLAQQAMKSNPNGLIGLLVSFLWELVLAACLLLPSFLHISFLWGLGLSLLLLAVLAPFSYSLAVRQAHYTLSR
jgi:ABC-2 type transport system permease protein